MLIMYLHKFDHFDKFRAYLVYYRKKSFFEKLKKKYFCPNGLNFCVCLKDICGTPCVRLQPILLTHLVWGRF